MRFPVIPHNYQPAFHFAPAIYENGSSRSEFALPPSALRVLRIVFLRLQFFSTLPTMSNVMQLPHGLLCGFSLIAFIRA